MTGCRSDGAAVCAMTQEPSSIALCTRVVTLHFIREMSKTPIAIEECEQSEGVGCRSRMSRIGDVRNRSQKLCSISRARTMRWITSTARLGTKECGYCGLGLQSGGAVSKEGEDPRSEESDYSANADAIDDNTRGVSAMVNWDAGEVWRRLNTGDLARTSSPPILKPGAKLLAVSASVRGDSSPAASHPQTRRDCKLHFRPPIIRPAGIWILLTRVI